jgi:hypothetical protein
MVRMLRRLLKIAATSLLVLAALAAAGLWLAVHDEVAAMRKLSRRAKTPPPLVTSAVAMAEGFSTGPLSLRMFECLDPRVRCCGPSPLAYRMSRVVTAPESMARWHAETMLVSVVISRLFTPDELLAAYMNELYLGQMDGRQVIGVEAASAAYFGKTAPELSVGQAATLAAIARSPHYYSPLRHPERTLTRRNRVLRTMLERRAITAAEYQRALAEPLQRLLSP